MKKIVLTGGGSAGHVTPHLALVQKLKSEYEIHYIGSGGIEREIIKKFPFITFHEITCAKLIRSLNLKNFLIPFKLLKGIKQSKTILNKIKPNIIFSKGGFVAVPVVFAAHKLNVPVISHESDITMGLANKLMLNKSKVMCCSFKLTTQKCPNKCVFTGTPIREQLFNGSREVALKQCGFTQIKPCILIMGGSLGAIAINKVVINCLPQLLKKFNVIHIVGKGNLTSTNLTGYYQCEFTNQIQHFFALCDIVVSRAGSNSINEFLSLAKPMLLIPLPRSASRGDQILNAQEFEKNGYSITLYQQNLSPLSLINNIEKLYNNKNNYIKKLKAAKTSDATNTIINLINSHSKNN